MTSKTILAFPASAQRQQVRQAAVMLNNVHGEAATAAWKELVRSIANQLTAMGIPHEEVRHQVLAFQASVQQELQAIA